MSLTPHQVLEFYPFLATQLHIDWEQLGVQGIVKNMRQVLGTPPHCTTSHHLTSPHTTSHHLTPPHNTSHRLTPPHCTASRHLTPPHTTSHHLTSPHTASQHLTTPHRGGIHGEKWWKMEKFSNFSTRFSINIFTIFHHFSPFFTILKINLLNIPELSLNCSDLFRPRQFVKGDLMGTKHVIKIT